MPYSAKLTLNCSTFLDVISPTRIKDVSIISLLPVVYFGKKHFNYVKRLYCTVLCCCCGFVIAGQIWQVGLNLCDLCVFQIDIFEQQFRSISKIDFMERYLSEV